MIRSAAENLKDLRFLEEAVVMDVSLTDLLRTATLTVDRGVDPERSFRVPSGSDPHTGVVLYEISKRVVRISVHSVVDAHLSNRGLGERMWGPEANWGLNEIALASLAEGEGWTRITLEWESDRRRLEFTGSSISFSFLEPEAAERALRDFWGDENWR
ncbi:hypothetical protein EON79_22295 [bacterium]|nr:MAG: hypothetical protein EON79_22295 [bacterium]